MFSAAKIAFFAAFFAFCDEGKQIIWFSSENTESLLERALNSFFPSRSTSGYLNNTFQATVLSWKRIITWNLALPMDLFFVLTIESNLGSICRSLGDSRRDAPSVILSRLSASSAWVCDDHLPQCRCLLTLTAAENLELHVQHRRPSSWWNATPFSQSLPAVRLL